jgi:hypothetical protein
VSVAGSVAVIGSPLGALSCARARAPKPSRRARTAVEISRGRIAGIYSRASLPGERKPYARFVRERTSITLMASLRQRALNHRKDNDRSHVHGVVVVVRVVEIDPPVMNQRARIGQIAVGAIG